MAQEAQKRVQEGVTKLLGDLDSAVLRKMQVGDRITPTPH